MLDEGTSRSTIEACKLTQWKRGCRGNETWKWRRARVGGGDSVVAWGKFVDVRWGLGVNEP